MVMFLNTIMQPRSGKGVIWLAHSGPTIRLYQLVTMVMSLLMVAMAIYKYANYRSSGHGQETVRQSHET